MCEEICGPELECEACGEPVGYWYDDGDVCGSCGHELGTEPPFSCLFCHGTDGEWFDRSICPDPCGWMHYRCNDCGRVQGGCALENPLTRSNDEG